MSAYDEYLIGYMSGLEGAESCEGPSERREGWHDGLIARMGL